MGRTPPHQLAPITEVMGWHIDESAMAAIEAILSETIKDPVGPEFMAPLDRLAQSKGSPNIPFSGGVRYRSRIVLDSVRCWVSLDPMVSRGLSGVRRPFARQ
jgi:hypothetical protein